MQSRAPRRTDTLLSAAFLLALAAPWIDQLARDDDARGPARELRNIAPRPPIPRGLFSIATFPEAYERHFNDTLGLRDVLLRFHSVEQLFGFGVAPGDAMVLGENHWLYYTGDRSIPVYRGLRPLSEHEIDGWLATWEQRRDFLAQRGIGYLFAVAPSKESIYPEFMPARFNKVGPSRWDQLAERLKQRPDLPVLDLRDELRAQKAHDTADEFTYVPLGTHWNARGHYAGYRAIAKALQQRYPPLAILDLDDLVPVVMPGNGDSWADRMYIGDLLPQRDAQLRPARSDVDRQMMIGHLENRLRVFARDRPDLPRVVVLHDSFGGNVADLLAESCQAEASLQTPDFDVDFIERARPDVVVEIYVERVFVSWPTPRPSPAAFDTDRKRFERSTHEIARLDPSQVIRAAASTSVEVTRRDGAPLAVVDAAGADARFFLSLAAPANAGQCVLHARLEIPHSSLLRVYVSDPKTGQLARTNLRWASLRSGVNDIHLRFRAAELTAPLYCLLASPHGPCTIQELELRAVDPD